MNLKRTIVCTLALLAYTAVNVVAAIPVCEGEIAASCECSTKARCSGRLDPASRTQPRNEAAGTAQQPGCCCEMQPAEPHTPENPPKALEPLSEVTVTPVFVSVNTFDPNWQSNPVPLPVSVDLDSSPLKTVLRC